MNGFYVAPYAPDAALLGIAFWEVSALSARWIAVAGRFLHEHGTSFRAPWNEELATFETRLTSENGAALCTFYAEGQVASSHLYLSGRDPAAEADLTSMFVESLRRVRLVQLSAPPGAFADIQNLRERPIDVAIAWAPEGVADEVLGVARDLSIHFAAAFFT